MFARMPAGLRHGQLSGPCSEQQEGAAGTAWLDSNYKGPKYSAGREQAPEAV